MVLCESSMNNTPMIGLIGESLAYIVQGHRFNVFENLGCYPAIYNTLPTYFLVYMWPILIGLVSSVYCSKSERPACSLRITNEPLAPVMSFAMLFKRHNQLREFLQSGSALTVSRYYRLKALAITEILFTIPLAYTSYTPTRSAVPCNHGSAGTTLTLTSPSSKRCLPLYGAPTPLSKFHWN